ncbi:hypothetical protein NYO98_11210 [Nocardioides sp. STR2]|jgi:hypothetical protein|uniref:DUF4386 domain-containing protein n=1 Tax=Nocardioides pini TaxID=2975053 RepID=A0ABT4CCZ7_9ACTN|nr:hypothetical protein [Nocardioides pini]MCY4726846.1 hypothetical protein [Nocardioides pini]
MTTTPVLGAAPATADRTLARLSAGFGIAFALGQLLVMTGMSVLVLPHVGAPGDPAAQRGQDILDVETAYRVSNYAFMVAGTLLLGFLGVVHVRLRRADASGVLSTVAVAAGSLLALVWPFAGVLHDVATGAAAEGTDVRLLAGWDAVAPYSLAFSVFPRLFFVGALVVGLRLAGTSPWLQRIGLVLLPVSLLGSATLLTDALFPLLALSTLAYELWVGALAWQWLRAERLPG